MQNHYFVHCTKNFSIPLSTAVYKILYQAVNAGSAVYKILSGNAVYKIVQCTQFCTLHFRIYCLYKILYTALYNISIIQMLCTKSLLPRFSSSPGVFSVFSLEKEKGKGRMGKLGERRMGRGVGERGGQEKDSEIVIVFFPFVENLLQKCLD